MVVLTKYGELQSLLHASANIPESAFSTSFNAASAGQHHGPDETPQLLLLQGSVHTAKQVHVCDTSTTPVVTAIFVVHTTQEGPCDA